LENENINTQSYWEERFSSGDWENSQGRQQTENFAKAQIQYLHIDNSFTGTILDFGCGLGDAIPIYRENFPQANLIGIDISHSAIELCRDKYGEIATFIQGNHKNIPDNVDVIIASNVLEHISEDLIVAKHLLSCCKSLYIVVPYQESNLHPEHINRYDEKYFSELGKYDYQIFLCKGWTPYGVKDLWYQVYFKNIFRFLLRLPLVYRNRQIIFHW